jgi:hypothetical protein
MKHVLNNFVAIYTNSPHGNAVANSLGRRLIISSHGGWVTANGRFNRVDISGALVGFYCREDQSVRGNLSHALTDAIQVIDYAYTSVKNYQLTRFADDPNEATLNGLLTVQYDVLLIRNAQTISLLNAIQAVRTAGYNYPEYRCLFCRYAGSAVTVDARARTHTEDADLRKVPDFGRVVQQLGNVLRPPLPPRR